jgi:hypothetical protein
MLSTAANPAAIKCDRQPSRRRTKRVALTASVEVSGEDVAKSSFSLTTTATNLNRNGAMLRLDRDLPVNSALVIKNRRGSRTSARVVSQTKVRDLYAYGVEFLEAENAIDFWGINFPSSQGRN